MDQGTQFRFPTLEPWMRNLLIGAFLLYAAELVTRNAGFDVYTFAWSPFGNGFAPWQPLTRYFVQGDYVFGVLMGMLMVYFLLPGLWMQVSADRLRNALLAGAVGGSLLPMLADLAVGDVGLVMGWTTLAFVYLPTMFGLTMASHTIYLFFVIPVNGRFLLWMTAVVSGLVFALSLGTGDIGGAEPLGTWLGTYGWWQLRGPGARRRELKRKAASIERQLRRFEVIEGGKGQGDQDNRDEWVN